MLESLIYLVTLALFSFVVVGAAMVRQEMLILVCIPPVFVALITGFIMAIYAADAFGLAPVGAALLAGVPPGWWCGRRLTGRRLLLAVYLAWAGAMGLALLAFSFPDRA